MINSITIFWFTKTGIMPFTQNFLFVKHSPKFSDMFENSWPPQRLSLNVLESDILYMEYTSRISFRCWHYVDYRRMWTIFLKFAINKQSLPISRPLKKWTISFHTYRLWQLSKPCDVIVVISFSLERQPVQVASEDPVWPLPEVHAKQVGLPFHAVNVYLRIVLEYLQIDNVFMA